MHAHAAEIGVEVSVGDREHDAAAIVLAVEPVNGVAELKDARERAEFVEHGKADGLQQDARADRPEMRRLFKEMDVVVLTREQNGGRLTGGSTTDDGNAEWAGHGIRGDDTECQRQRPPRERGGQSSV